MAPRRAKRFTFASELLLHTSSGIPPMSSENFNTLHIRYESILKQCSVSLWAALVGLSCVKSTARWDTGRKYVYWCGIPEVELRDAQDVLEHTLNIYCPNLFRQTWELWRLFSFAHSKFWLNFTTSFIIQVEYEYLKRSNSFIFTYSKYFNIHTQTPKFKEDWKIKKKINIYQKMLKDLCTNSY